MAAAGGYSVLERNDDAEPSRTAEVGGAPPSAEAETRLEEISRLQRFVRQLEEEIDVEEQSVRQAAAAASIRKTQEAIAANQAVRAERLASPLGAPGAPRGNAEVAVPGYGTRAPTRESIMSTRPGGVHVSRGDAWNRLDQMDGYDDEESSVLVQTPSVAEDLAGGLSEAEAVRGQRLRQQIRIVDAQIADAKAQIIRQQLLQGPTGRRFECDKDCIVGGCGETFAEEDGVLCECQLFLCHPCFGSRVVTNECQVGGRYDATITIATTGGMPSASGSLPCPLYPMQCSCGHIPLTDILRALLHESNRGEDGGFEDIESPGLSAHKIFLIARRRQAEAKLTRETRNASPESQRLYQFKLVRTISEATLALDQTIGLGRNPATYQSSACVALADKCDELKQLRASNLAARLLGSESDGEQAIPPTLRRRCAQCGGHFSCFEGGQCTTVARNHFLCNVCFGGYLMQACAPGGPFEQALTNRDNMVVSPAGKLPCPFFYGYETHLTCGTPTKLPSLDCRCGVIESSTIERVLMDPRNSSAPYWRERKATVAVDAQARVHGLLPGDQTTMGPWSWATEWLSRNWTPSAVHETASLRVSEEARQLETDARTAGAKTPEEVDVLAELSTRVGVALTEGSSIRCPSCGTHTVKDDACIHMDGCPCQASWCFLCGRLSGSDKGQCPRQPQPGGCDQQGLFLEQMQGWEGFALRGENPAYGAQQEFLRRRQAFFVRRVMEETDPKLWAQLRAVSPGLLTDCPTPGRKIEWDDVATAEFPSFGGLQRGIRELDDLLARDTVDASVNDDDTSARFEAYFRREHEVARRRELALRRRQRRSTVRAVVTFGIVASIVCLVALFRSVNPRHDLEPLVPNVTVAAGGRSPEQADCTRAVGFLPDSISKMRVPCACDSRCDLLWWFPVLGMCSAFVGAVRVATSVAAYASLPMLYLIFIMLWLPLFIGPLAHTPIALFFNPICAGALGTAFCMMPIAAVLRDQFFTRRTVNCIGICVCFLGYGCYLAITIHARSLYDGAPLTYDLSDATLGRADEFKLSDYTCPTACWAVRWIVRTTACLAAPGLVTIARVGPFWMTDWTDDGPPVLFPWALLTFLGVLWPEAVTHRMLATGPTGLIYSGLFFSTLLGCLAFSFARRSATCVERLLRVLEDYNVERLFAGLPAALGCAFLYLYRADVPEYEGATSTFATAFRVTSSCMLIGTAVCFQPALEFAAGRWVYFTAVYFTVVAIALWCMVYASWVMDADEQQRNLAFQITAPLSCLLGTFGCLWTYCKSAERQGGRCAKTKNCFACLVAVVANLYLYLYLYSPPDEMPRVFEIAGAHEWQAGNFSTVNGVYHLRTDLRDGEPPFTCHYHSTIKQFITVADARSRFGFTVLTGLTADPKHPPGEPCTDAWWSCYWQTLTSETTAIDGIDDACLLNIKGSYIYQRHDDTPSPGLDSLLLYRPRNEHLWVVAPGKLAFASCFKSTAAYLYSIRDTCARRPDGLSCVGAWRQAGPDGSWRPTLASVEAVKKCMNAPEGDMCCEVQCAKEGSDCKEEWRAGAWAGICNSTARTPSRP